MTNTAEPPLVKETISQMDKLISAYQLQGRQVERLLLSSKQWEALSNWHDKLAKVGAEPHNGISYDPVTKAPYYKGYRLERYSG